MTAVRMGSTDSLPMRPRMNSNGTGSLWQRRRRRSASISISPSRIVVVDHDEEEGRFVEDMYGEEGDEDDGDSYGVIEEEVSPRGRKK